MSPRRSAARWWTCAAIAAVFTAASAGPVRAAFIIDLTTANSSGSSQGALFHQADPKPTGTGVFDPFVRIQQTGSERGYNTDARPVEFETKDQNQWTHSLKLADLTSVKIQGTNYYKFTLDINEMGNPSGALLTMNDFRVYLGNSGSLTGWNDGFGTNSVKVYDIDAGASGDGRVDMNYRLGSGSGSGDMFVYIPVAKFQGFGSQFQYVYLYSAFGNPYSSDAGFEEWSAYVKTGSVSPPPPPPPPSNPVPAPAGLILGLIGIGGCLAGRGLRRNVVEPTTAA